MKRKTIVSTSISIAKKLPVKGAYIKFESVAFWFWFFIGIEPCLTFLFFINQPAIGTLVGYIPPAIFAFFLLTTLLIGGQLRHAEILKSMSVKMLLALSFWAGLTMFWTGANPRFSAFGYWAILALKIFIVLLLFLLGNVEKVAIKSLQGLTWGSLILGLVPFILNARTIDGRLGNEEFFHPNNIGNQMAITCLCAIYLALQSWGKASERRPYIVMLLFLLFTLLRSLSKTSILSFLIAASVYVLRSQISAQKKINLVLISGGIIAVSFTRLSTYLDTYLNEQQGGEALATGTGRTQIWEMTWNRIQENPIWGYGYQSYRDIADQIIGLRLVHPHNEVLNIWFNLGGVGLLLGVLTYIAYSWQVYCAAKARLPQEALALSLLIYFIIRGATEATVPDFLVYPSSLMMLMIGWMAQSQTVSSNNKDNYG
ncbi:MAG: O-antigen ligase family protein [Potamolinea sp.]